MILEQFQVLCYPTLSIIFYIIQTTNVSLKCIEPSSPSALIISNSEISIVGFLNLVHYLMLQNRRLKDDG